jgi:oligoendopeptidase F
MSQFLDNLRAMDGEDLLPFKLWPYMVGSTYVTGVRKLTQGFGLSRRCNFCRGVASKLVENVATSRMLQERAGHSSPQDLAAHLCDRLDNFLENIFLKIAYLDFEEKLSQTFENQGYVDAKTVNPQWIECLQAHLGESVHLDESVQWLWLAQTRFAIAPYSAGEEVVKSVLGLVLNRVFADRLDELAGRLNQLFREGLHVHPPSFFMELGVDLEDPHLWDQALEPVEKVLGQFTEVSAELGFV